MEKSYLGNSPPKINPFYAIFHLCLANKLLAAHEAYMNQNYNGPHSNMYLNTSILMKHSS